MLRLVLAGAGLAVLAALGWVAAADSRGVPAARAPAPRPDLLRMACEDPDAFAPLPESGPSDWLANHEEPGQTFEEFRIARRRAVTEERRTIRLLALDDLGKVGVPVSLVVEHVGAFFGLPTVEHAAGAPPAFTTRRARVGVEQTLSTDVLAWLRSEVPSDAYGLVALTSRDLYPEPSWNYVFGQASLVARVGVFSFARLAPEFPEEPPAKRKPADRALVLRRCWKLVSHEVGHLFGMQHCVHHACVMNGGNHLAEMDAAPAHLCPVCLEKLHHAAPFDPLERYRRLEALYRREGLAAEADWNAARVAFLRHWVP
jgi:archaemetzincin